MFWGNIFLGSQRMMNNEWGQIDNAERKAFALYEAELGFPPPFH